MGRCGLARPHLCRSLNKDLSWYTESVRRESTENRRPQIYSWGRGDCGQLGLGSASDVPEPTRVATPGAALMACAGEQHSACVRLRETNARWVGGWAGYVCVFRKPVLGCIEADFYN